MYATKIILYFPDCLVTLHNELKIFLKQPYLFWIFVFTIHTTICTTKCECFNANTLSLKNAGAMLLQNFYHIVQNTYLRTRPPYGLKCICRFLFTLLHIYLQYPHKYKILHMKVSLYAILTMVKHEKVNSLQLYICMYILCTRYMHTCTGYICIAFYLTFFDMNWWGIFICPFGFISM